MSFTLRLGFRSKKCHVMELMSVVVNDVLYDTSNIFNYFKIVFKIVAFLVFELVIPN